jgi:hypothetical protein
MDMFGSNPRSLHLVDVENLIGTPRPTLEQVIVCRDSYGVFVGHDDHVIVSCNHGAYITVGWVWPGARRLVRSGLNGADLALLDVLARERVAERFSTVFVGSGDGLFADAVASLGAIGVDVTVVSRPEALSRRLELAAGRVQIFTFDPGPVDTQVQGGAA